jgi:hypothetical protein
MDSKFNKWMRNLADDMSKIVEAEDTLKSKPGDTSDIPPPKIGNTGGIKPITIQLPGAIHCVDIKGTLVFDPIEENPAWYSSGLLTKEQDEKRREYISQLCNIPKEDHNRWFEGTWKDWDDNFNKMFGLDTPLELKSADTLLLAEAIALLKRSAKAHQNTGSTFFVEITKWLEENDY